jgi:hypothetical protein
MYPRDTPVADLEVTRHKGPSPWRDALRLARRGVFFSDEARHRSAFQRPAYETIFCWRGVLLRYDVGRHGPTSRIENALVWKGELDDLPISSIDEHVVALSQLVVEPSAASHLVSEDVGHGLATVERDAGEEPIDAFGEFHIELGHR